MLESARSPGKRRAWTAGIWAVALLLIPYLGFLGTHRLWPPFEPELVETAREMQATGNVVVPQLNGHAYPEKPPLYYWEALAAARLRGTLDETAGRLPSAISLLLLAFTTATFGARRFGWRSGLLAGVALGTMPLSFRCGTAGMCDLPLALAVTGALFLIHEATCAEGAPRGWALVLAGALAGVSLLAKSLVGPALILLGSVPVALSKERKLPAARYWVLAAVAGLAVVLPWVVAIGGAEGREFLVEVFLHQTVDRFLGGGEAKGSIVHYFGTVPTDMLPWSLFLPLAFLHAGRLRAKDPARWSALRFLLVGAGIELAFLSLSACRMGKYAAPVFPQLALWIGCALDDETLDRRLVSVPALGIATAFAGVAAAAPFVVAARFPALAGVTEAALPLALAVAAGLYVLARTARGPVIGLALAVALAATATFTEAVVYPVVDEIRTDRPLEEAIVKHVSADTPYASYGLGTRSYIIFYTKRTSKELYGRKELEDWVHSVAPRPAYFLTRDDYLARFASESALAPRLEAVGRNPPGIGHDDYVLVRVRPQ